MTCDGRSGCRLNGEVSDIGPVYGDKLRSELTFGPGVHTRPEGLNDVLARRNVPELEFAIGVDIRAHRHRSDDARSLTWTQEEAALDRFTGSVERCSRYAGDTDPREGKLAGQDVF